MASRTIKSIKNGQIAMLYNLANLILGFYSRKVFIDYVGIELLGLNQTAQNLLGFLNLAELGIGSAVAFTLYKPLSLKDNETIVEIVSVQGWLYRKIAYIIVSGAILLSLFFPIIFKNVHLPLWYAYASFGVFLYSSLLTYFVNYRQIVLSANQQEYKIVLNYNGVMLFKTVLQIICLQLLPNPYIAWLILQVIFSTIASVTLNIAIKREFPFLATKASQGRSLMAKYQIITTKIKHTFFHAIGGFVLTQSSSLLIFAFVDLSVVAIYGNYMLITNCIRMIFNSMFSGVTAGIGNLVSENAPNKAMKVFEELYSAKFLIITASLTTFFYFANPFMSIWIGKEYLLQNSSILIICLSLYIILSRTTIDSYIFATGLFQDIWAPIAEATLNIGLSILLGSLYGINGVLGGALASLVIIIYIWKPYFLFKKGLHLSIKPYIKMNIVHLIGFIITLFATKYTYDLFKFPTPIGYIEWGIQAATYFFVFGLILFVYSFLFSSGMRDFTQRILFLIKTNVR